MENGQMDGNGIDWRVHSYPPVLTETFKLQLRSESHTTVPPGPSNPLQQLLQCAQRADWKMSISTCLPAKRSVLPSSEPRFAA